MDKLNGLEAYFGDVEEDWWDKGPLPELDEEDQLDDDEDRPVDQSTIDLLGFDPDEADDDSC